MTDINDFKTIPEFLQNNISVWPDCVGVRHYDFDQKVWHSLTWSQFNQKVMTWRRSFAKLGLPRGTRVAAILPNSLDAIIFDQAALANALCPVPLHASDTAGNAAFVLNDSGAEFLVTVSIARWRAIEECIEDLPALKMVVLTGDCEEGESFGHTRYVNRATWEAMGEDVTELPAGPQQEDLAALIYTSGTTGKPKGVMLTHKNIVRNIQQLNEVVHATHDEVMLSFLPLSHAFERTVSYYLSFACGGSLAISRGLTKLTEDFQEVNPTFFCAVPRVFEKISAQLMAGRRKMNENDGYMFDWTIECGWRRFAKRNDLPMTHTPREFLDEIVGDYLQKRVGNRILHVFGNRIRLLIAGGAALNYSVAQFFCAMGCPVLQGYGLSEASPVVSVSRLDINHPATVGPALPDTEIKLGENNELLVRGDQVMKGYWNRPEATADVLSEDGWLHTGDQADLSDGGRIRISGRIKEIIVTSTGENISPTDVELAIQKDHLFEQVILVGEARPFISTICVVNKDMYGELCKGLNLDPDDPETAHCRPVKLALLKRIRDLTGEFPRYAQPRGIIVQFEHWSLEQGLLTSTLKLRRREITKRFAQDIERLYAETPSA